MKTIQVSDEMYDKLIELATEMTTQDPRGTRIPHLFQIRTKKKVIDWNLNGDFKVWVEASGDYVDIETQEDLESYLENRDIAIPENLKEMFDDHDWELDAFIEDFCPDLEECSYSWEYQYENAFFTAKACKEHIETNHYHYNDPKDYLNHAWRNPEMDLVSEFLCQLVGKKPHT